MRRLTLSVAVLLLCCAVAIAAAEMARDGLDAPVILARLEPIRARVQAVTTPATLRYLIAGGRAPRLKGNIGEVLDIKNGAMATWRTLMESPTTI